MGRNHICGNDVCSKHSWMVRLAGWCFGLGLAIALFTGHAAADARKPVVSPNPEYPEIARRMNISGTVKVEIVIAADGSIKSAKVLGGHPLLADAVQRALKKWKYAPAASDSTLLLDFKF
jgi:TonB family protein